MTRKAAPDTRPDLTVAQAAKRLGLSRQSVYNLIHERRIGCTAAPGIRGDRTIFRIPAAEVDRYQSEHFKAATA